MAAEEKPNKIFSLGGFSWKSMSFATRVTTAFALIALFTAIIMIGMISIVWGQYFANYTTSNVETIAINTANRMAQRIDESGIIDESSIQPAKQTAELSQNVCVKVLDSDGNTIYDSTVEQDENGNVISRTEPTDITQIALANVIVDNTVLGSVRVWTNGSGVLMEGPDVEFRDNSYGTLMVAGVVAVFFALGLGFVFARSLVQPIIRIARTAEKVKDGDLSARAEVDGEDEISQLGETFDQMVDSLERDRKLEQRLVSDVAHELRTPLMSIQSTVEAMIDGVYATDQEHLERVDNEVRRLGRLVEALLKLSRLENRSQPMKEEIFDLGDLTREIVRTHEVFVKDSGLSITFGAMSEVPVKADPDMIGQAIVNLLSNAIRYTQEGGRIDVVVGRGNTMAYIAVSDNGIGLSPEEAKMVFSRFWRADEGRNRASGGLGIGLSVVKEIIDRHNGWINVEGEKGKGATFTVYLPVYDDEEDGKVRRRDKK